MSRHSEATDTLTEIHLWPQGNAVRWWNPWATGLLHSKTLTAAEQEIELLHRLLSIPLVEQALHTGRVVLHLEDTLPETWQRLPWEALRLNGVPLRGRLLAVRYAPASIPPKPLPPKPLTALLNLWPPEESAQAFRGMGGGMIREYRGAAARYFAGWGKLASLAALVVIAHGGEQTAVPFRDERDRDWLLPQTLKLPPLVILLACGSEQGNLLAYGRTLLAAGAQTVLAPAGQLSAPQAGAFLRDFLAGWQTGRRIDELLLAFQADQEAIHGACQLRVLGRATLRSTSAPTPEELPDEPLAQVAREELDHKTLPKPAFAALLIRITRADYRFLPGLHPDTALSRLNVALRLDQTSRDQVTLLRSLQVCEPPLPTLCRSWVLALMAYLAEVHDHSLLRYCERTRYALDTHLSEAPLQRYHWSKLYYREGRYGHALAELAAGLKLPTQGETTTALLGTLLNILIDLNLPQAARVVHEHLDDALQSATPEALRQRHNLLDREARLALRLGQPARALGIYRRKREEARLDGHSDLRELAWLLYIGAWRGDSASAGDYAAEVVLSLSDIETVTTNTGKGNEDTLYLLRALALWAWRTGDAKAARRVLNYRDWMHARLVQQDPGPLGMTLAYLRLYRRDHGLRTDSSLDADWEEACVLLERDGYWLELAALQHFLDLPLEARRCLERFQRRRRAVSALKELTYWLPGSDAESWEAFLEHQETLEKAVFSETSTVEAVVKSGLLPL